MADAPDPAAQDHSEGSRNRTNSRVEHEYIDYAVEAALLESQQRAYDPGEAPSSNDPFPIYLHYILHQTEKAGLSHIVSWCPHGRAFVVHNRELFVRTVLPKYVSIEYWNALTVSCSHVFLLALFFSVSAHR